MHSVIAGQYPAGRRCPAAYQPAYREQIMIAAWIVRWNGYRIRLCPRNERSRARVDTASVTDRTLSGIDGTSVIELQVRASPPFPLVGYMSERPSLRAWSG
jgi:hypothetical protein